VKRTLTCLLTAAAAVFATGAAAHTAWLERTGRPDVWRLMFGGHQGRQEPADPARLRSVAALDARGRPLSVSRTVNGSDLSIAVAGQPALIVMHYDNGIHTRTAVPGPSVPRPMNEVPGAVSATSAQKHHKTIVRWTPVVARPVGQPFEVTPVSSEQPRAGRAMRVRVLQDGRPVAGVNIGRGEDSAHAATDAQGIASFTPAAGANKLWAGRRIETRSDPRYTQLSYEYLLAFEAR
jgi:nickel transport protein